MGVDGKIYAELATLCEREETAGAQALIDRDTLSPPTLLSLLQQAVIAENPRVLLVLLGCASRATCNLNAPLSKVRSQRLHTARAERSQDGKTLLHLAVAKRNLIIVRYLLDAGADLKAKDKKGVRVVDTVTWTDAVFPAVAIPLQNAVFKLEQRNEALEKHTEQLIDTTRKTRYETENVELENDEVQAHFKASVQYKKSLKDQTEATKARIEATEDSIRSQGPRTAYIEEEIKTTKSTIAGLVQQVDSTEASTVAFKKESERLRAVHADQLRQLSVVEKQSTVKCEAVETMQLFDSDEMLQEKFLRALAVTCQHVNAVKKLAMGGIQARLVDVLLRYGAGNATIFRLGISVLIQLIYVKAKHPDDHVLCTYLKPWPSSLLVPTLADAAVALAVKSDDPNSFLCLFIELVHQLEEEPAQSDLSREDFADIVRTASQTMLQHPILSNASASEIRASIEKLATPTRKG